jgi:hypothetical protein
MQTNADNVPRRAAAGAKLPEKIGGTPAVREVLREYGMKD